MLRYLFRAYFADGETFDQAEDDTARLHPERAGQGSSYTDLLWLVEHDERRIDAFALCENGEPVAAVHLTDGRFELCGNGFYAGSEALGEGVRRRLVYFRQVRRDRTQTVDMATGEASDWVETVHTRYFLGWRAWADESAIQDAREVEHVIGIDE